MAKTGPKTAASETPRTFLNRRRNLTPEQRQAKPLAYDFWTMMKPEIAFLVVLSALAGFVLAPTESFAWMLLAHTLWGTLLTAGGSGVLNHYLEREADKTMKRTAQRPLPAGRISPNVALIFGLALAIMGSVHLWLFVNALTAALAVLTIGLYLLLYTPMKRVTTLNTLIGCVPGALPALGGWTAATGSFGMGGWVLFAILFAWQLPHFLSLAWMYRQDYERGGFAMLPVVDPEGLATGRQTLGFTLALVAASILPFFLDLSGVFYLIAALLLGGYFLRPSIRFWRTRTPQTARRVLLASVMYIPLLVLCIIADRVLLAL